MLFRRCAFDTLTSHISVRSSSDILCFSISTLLMLRLRCSGCRGVEACRLINLELTVRQHSTKQSKQRKTKSASGAHAAAVFDARRLIVPQVNANLKAGPCKCQQSTRVKLLAKQLCAKHLACRDVVICTSLCVNRRAKQLRSIIVLAPSPRVCAARRGGSPGTVTPNDLRGLVQPVVPQVYCTASVQRNIFQQVLIQKLYRCRHRLTSPSFRSRAARQSCPGQLERSGFSFPGRLRMGGINEP